MSVHLPVITNSAITTFRRCAREFQFAHVFMRRTLEKARALVLGTGWDLATEAWWNAPHSQRFECASDALNNYTGWADEYERARFWALLCGYHARWYDEAAPMAVEGVKLRAAAPLVNPDTGAASKTWRLGGELDGMVRLDGHYIAERKTTSEDIGPGSDYYKALRINSQVSTYYTLARSLGFADVKGVLYDITRKPAHRPLKATPVESRKYKADGTLYANQRDRDETPEEYAARIADAIAAAPDHYYQWATVVRLAAEEEEAARDVWHWARLAREAEVSGRFPRNVDACKRWGRTCDYFPVCTGEASIEDDTRYRTVETRNEELAA